MQNRDYKTLHGSSWNKKDQDIKERTFSDLTSNNDFEDDPKDATFEVWLRNDKIISNARLILTHI